MKILIDGDALPNLLKPILLKGIQRSEIKTIVVSNKKISLGKSSLHVEYILVELGLDGADKYITKITQENDLVITADIPLADLVVQKGAVALGHRGEVFDKESIKQFLVMRNLMEELRSSGEMTKGPKPFGKKEAQYFANEFNKYLQKMR